MKINYSNDQVSNINVYGMFESMVRGGYPMTTSTSHFEDDVNELYTMYDKDSSVDNMMTNKHFKRTTVLGNAKAGSGHSNVLKGILVDFDLEYNHVMTPQLQRYHFIDFVSSQSKMHRAVKMNLRESCSKYTSRVVVDECIRLMRVYEYKQENLGNNHEETKVAWNTFIESLPLGLKLTGGMTTNYLQLQTIYNQRKNHKYYYWEGFCDFCDALPYFKELTGCTREK